MDKLEKVIVVAFLFAAFSMLGCMVTSAIITSRKDAALRLERPGYCEKCGRWDGQPVAERR